MGRRIASHIAGACGYRDIEPVATTARAAVFIDLENLIYRERAQGDLDAAVARVEALLACVRERATVVACVAVCDRRLAADLAAPLARSGIRVHTHLGGPDAADAALSERMEHDTPASCGLVVVASGDHYFAPAVERLRAAGRVVEVVSRVGQISALLYRRASRYIDLAALEAERASAASMIA